MLSASLWLVAVLPPATMRCPMAEEVAHWLREDIAPAVNEIGPPLRGLDNFASYDCRGRNNIRAAQLSEHGHADALDLLEGNQLPGRRAEIGPRQGCAVDQHQHLVGVGAAHEHAGLRADGARLRDVEADELAQQRQLPLLLLDHVAAGLSSTPSAWPHVVYEDNAS